MSNINKLLYLTGVASEYLDYSGQQQHVSWQVQLAALRGAGHDISDEDAIDQALYEIDVKPWLQCLNAFYVVAEKRKTITFHSHPEQLHEPIQWQFLTEGGRILDGAIVPAELPECGDYYYQSIRYSAREFTLPEGVEAGYHQLIFQCAEQQQQATVALCPTACHAFPVDEKRWGVSCQLYTLRSENNWGMGDFSDLQQLIGLAAAQGADFIGLNPLHALCNDADSISPYSPSDRRFINPLYISIEWAVQTLQFLATAQWQSETFTSQLTELRSTALIDYARVSQLKYQAFDQLYLHFIQQHLTEGSQVYNDFLNFVTEQGDALRTFCLYEVEHNSQSQWFSDDLRFYQLLQWLAFEQLTQCQQHTQKSKMGIGLVGDLAVGSIKKGCEVQSNPALFIERITIGAPPDPLASSGQDWGLPVVNPLTMRSQNYRHFMSLIRANMVSVGALRIDHVMALMRLWWCIPEVNSGEKEGLYVYYPMTELLGLLRLESQRNRCAIIGEDLGIVPEQMRQALQESGIYSNNLMYFEQYHDRAFKAPSQQLPEALLMVTNHDVATLAQWWSAEDIQCRLELGLLGDADRFVRLCEERASDKQQLFNWLAEHRLLPQSWQERDLGRELDYDLCRAIHQLNARSASHLLSIQLEDLQLMKQPVNIPGTYKEYPNWQRKQARDAQDIFSDSRVLNILRVIDKERK